MTLHYLIFLVRILPFPDFRLHAAFLLPDYPSDLMRRRRFTSLARSHVQYPRYANGPEDKNGDRAVGSTSSDDGQGQGLGSAGSPRGDRSPRPGPRTPCIAPLSHMDINRERLAETAEAADETGRA